MSSIIKETYGNIKILNIPLDSLGFNGSIHPVLLWDDQSTILVDVGITGLFSVLKEEIEKLNIPICNLTKIIITHADLDHIGNLALLQNKIGENLEIIAHSFEKPFIEFEEKSVKISYEKFEEVKPILKSKVNCQVEHGDEIEALGGIEVIHTPGHTPGHICLYVKKQKVLIAGDALNVVDGNLLGPNAKYSPDISQANESLKQFLSYDIDSVICYHGGLYRGDFRNAINQLLINAGQ